MTDKNRVWIDPHGRALRFLDEAQRQEREEAERRHKEEIARQQSEAERQRKEEAERKRREEQAMKREEEKQNAARTQVLAAQPKPEILPPGSRVPALAPPDTTAVPGLDLAEFERQIRSAAKMLDLSVPEGLLDRMIGRPDHRIDMKTDRGRRLAGYIAACTAIVQAAGSLQDARRQVYLDHLTFLLRVAEAQQKLEAVAENARLQGQIEDAKAREIISEHEAKIRENGLRGRPVPPPLPPPPPPPPPPTPAELRAKKRDSLRKELDRLASEEKAELAKITGGKPQGEWTEEMHEEIKRTNNMYYHAKQKVRDELREYV